MLSITRVEEFSDPPAAPKEKWEIVIFPEYIELYHWCNGTDVSQDFIDHGLGYHFLHSRSKCESCGEDVPQPVITMLDLLRL